MQDSVRDPFDDSQPSGVGLASQITKWAGAALSVALLAGVTLWTYQIGQRDAMAVPVIQALKGPAKEPPKDPGGLRAAHQGLSVTTIMEGPRPQPRPAAIERAPQPAELAAEDLPASELPSEPAEEVVPDTETAADTADPTLAEPDAPKVADLAAVPPEAPAADAPLAEVTPPGPPAEPAQEVASLTAPPVTPLPRTRNETEAVTAPEPDTAPAPESLPITPPERLAMQNTADTGTTPAPVAEDELGEARSLTRPPAGPIDPPPATARPDPLPPEVAETPAAADVADLPPTATAPRSTRAPIARPRAATPETRPDQSRTETDAAATREEATPVSRAPNTDPPKGTVLVQLGAFDAPEIARSEWDRLLRRNSDLLGTKGMLVQRTVSSGRVFYRLRAEGFTDMADARSTCAALRARGLACITARQD